MKNIHNYYTVRQKKKAKKVFRTYKAKHPFAWKRGRDNLISSILSSKPTFELKLII